MGIMVRDPHQAIGTMSAAKKQCLAIARAIHFGARVLILDEPTAASGVKQSFNVLKLIYKARERGISVIFITHNAPCVSGGRLVHVIEPGQVAGHFTRIQ
jgi:simple sugar transport system ATP-binding protein